MLVAGISSTKQMPAKTHSGLWRGCFVAPWDFRHWRKHTALLLGSCPDKAAARNALFPDHADMPPGCTIKGTAAVRARITGYRGIYHLEGGPSYRTVRAVHRGSARRKMRGRQASARPTIAEARPNRAFSSEVEPVRVKKTRQIKNHAASSTEGASGHEAAQFQRLALRAEQAALHLRAAELAHRGALLLGFHAF